MTDRQPTPREEAALRRLLRDARHNGPVPAEVAVRTEETLASLGAGGQVGGGARAGADHHRRRRAATALLVAAVSVLVVGIGIGQVVRPASEQASDSAASGSAGSTARDTPPDRTSADEERAQAEADPLGGAAGSGRSEALASSAPTPVERLALVEDPPAVREARFARDVMRVRALQRDERRERSAFALPDGTELAPRDPAPGFTCEQTGPGPGRAVAVRYDQAPAVLVLRPPTRATQVVDLVECGTGDVVRSLTLPR